MKSLHLWVRYMFRWIRALMGRSYYHQPQSLGKAFRPDELAGYFNDFTAKTDWTGEVDEQGLPVCVLADGTRVRFVTTIVQKAIGHWDKWLLAQSELDKDEFLKICWWLVAIQDDQGGWPVWSDLGLSLPSPYSAMTQGECISAFVRAWKLTDDEQFVKAAQRALELLIRPLDIGGPAVVESGELYLEEMPSYPRSSILNGWIYALFGIRDFWLAFDDSRAWSLFNRSLDTLKHHLSDFDAGFWSFYDTSGRMASLYYHNTHINQLKALIMVDASPEFVALRDTWITYQRNRSNRARALWTKALQKLRNPGEVVVVR